ncbi:TetR/AcrR family transcriptional regulator [soil metagenome]
MPRPTFLALADEKRDRVVAAAVAEFARHSYGAASLDRVAFAAEVSKGSLYQYFADKQDLYGWLVTVHLPAEKRKTQSASSPSPASDFFGWLAASFHAGLRQFRDEPLLAALAARAASPASDPEVAAVHGRLRALTHDGLCALIRGAKKNADVRRDVPDDLAAELVGTLMGTALVARMARRVGVTPEAFLAEPARAHTLAAGDVRALVDDAVVVLRRALAP